MKTFLIQLLILIIHSILIANALPNAIELNKPAVATCIVSLCGIVFCVFFMLKQL